MSREDKKGHSDGPGVTVTRVPVSTHFKSPFDLCS